jgi:hypothetical protein
MRRITLYTHTVCRSRPRLRTLFTKTLNDDISVIQKLGHPFVDLIGGGYENQQGLQQVFQCYVSQPQRIIANYPGLMHHILEKARQG